MSVLVKVRPLAQDTVQHAHYTLSYSSFSLTVLLLLAMENGSTVCPTIAIMYQYRRVLVTVQYTCEAFPTEVTVTQ